MIMIPISFSPFSLTRLTPTGATRTQKHLQRPLHGIHPTLRHPKPAGSRSPSRLVSLGYVEVGLGVVWVVKFRLYFWRAVDAFGVRYRRVKGMGRTRMLSVGFHRQH